MNKEKMNKGNKGQIAMVGVLIIMFVGIVVGLALLTPITNTTTSMTTQQISVNESDNLSANGCYEGSQQVHTNDTNCNLTVTYNPPSLNFGSGVCPISSVAVTNSSGTVLTVNVDYKVDANNGIVAMLNTSATNQSTTKGVVLQTYTYCPYGYNTDAGSRSVANLIVLFAVLGILAFVIYYAWTKGLIDLSFLGV